MKIALVTGANRGIGLEICRELDQAGFRVILGSRDYVKGQQAARSLGPEVLVKQLDVTSEDSIQHLFESLATDYGKIDILINNAGIWHSHSGVEDSRLGGLKKTIDHHLPAVSGILRKMMPILRNAGIGPQTKGPAAISLDSVKTIMETNFYGSWRMIQVFLPLLLQSEDPRIINMSSGMGVLASLDGTYPAYRLSKNSLNALTIMFSKELAETKIKINAMCPGWVRSDMGGPNAPRSLAEGADTAVWLATASEIPTGKLYHDRKEIPW